MARIEEYQNFVLNLKSFCERDMYIHSPNLAFTDYKRGYYESRKDLNQYILAMISRLDTGFYFPDSEDDED